MKRHIELAVIEYSNNTVVFRVIDQTHRCSDFCDDGEHFIAMNGVYLHSETCPEVLSGHSLCLMGSNKNRDDELLTTDGRSFIRFMEAIAEYNETNGVGHTKEWPQDGDTFYQIVSTGDISSATYYRSSQISTACMDIGNFFKTREEAEAALEQVKKVLIGSKNI